MSTESSQTEKESALRTASKNGEVIHVRSLLDEKANPNCTNSVIKIESIIDLWFINVSFLAFKTKFINWIHDHSVKLLKWRNLWTPFFIYCILKQNHCSPSHCYLFLWLFYSIPLIRLHPSKGRVGRWCPVAWWEAEWVLLRSSRRELGFHPSRIRLCIFLCLVIARLITIGTYCNNEW